MAAMIWKQTDYDRSIGFERYFLHTEKDGDMVCSITRCRNLKDDSPVPEGEEGCYVGIIQPAHDEPHRDPEDDTVMYFPTLQEAQRQMEVLCKLDKM